jgi:hypothetical protein
VTDFANHAAAVAAGWTRIQVTRPNSPRYVPTYEKYLIGEPGSAGGPFRADGSSDVDQATADASALAALNAQHAHRYGTRGANSSPGSKGGAMTIDVLLGSTRLNAATSARSACVSCGRAS